jgi:glycosyltransferase involved in cell wall biosynthesis
MDDPALQDLYRSASIFALATRYEGYGMVLGEAMRHGLPIVSCRVGAVPDTVPSRAGLLVHPSDPDAFARKLRDVLGDATLRNRMASASAQAGKRLPDWSVTADIVAHSLEPQ